MYKRVGKEDINEVLNLISKLNPSQKELVLAALRGAVLIAESNGGKQNDAE